MAPNNCQIVHMRLFFATQMGAFSVGACERVRMFSFVEVPPGTGQFPTKGYDSNIVQCMLIIYNLFKL